MFNLAGVLFSLILTVIDVYKGIEEGARLKDVKWVTVILLIILGWMGVGIFIGFDYARGEGALTWIENELY